jgi:hypothetical protein
MSMRKFSLFLLVAVVMAGAIYAVHAYAGNGSDAKIDAKAKSAVQTGGEVADPVAQCPKNADCPRDCEGCPGQCANCPNYADKDKDGQCDRQGDCPATPVRSGCSGHAGRACGRHG